MSQKPLRNHPAIRQPTWQNPLIEYWDAKRRKTPRRIILERQIMAMLAFFSVSIGLWENFRQLWLQDNGFSVTDVSNIISFGMLVAVVGIVIVGRCVKMGQIKDFMAVTLIIRTLNMVVMLLFNNSNYAALINICSIIDVVSGCLIVTSVYPLLTTVMKSNNTYSRRKLVEYLFRDLGILVGALTIGRVIGWVVVDYNICLAIAGVFAAISTVIMTSIKITITESSPQSKFSAFRFVCRSRIHRTYMVYVFLSAAAYNAVIGLRMLMLTDYFSLNASLATVFLLVVGLGSDILGIVALRRFTPKNDYLTLIIKYGLRLIIFIPALLTGDLFLCFICLAWTLLSSTAYENITDGYYINAVANRYQLKYNTFRYVIAYAGEALGVFLCGQMFQIGIEYIFGLSSILIILQLASAFHLIRLRTGKSLGKSFQK